MSLYNAIFGQNPLSGHLMALLGSPDVGRFRDAYVAREGDDPVIAIYTRNGGGNRHCWHEGSPEYGSAKCKNHEWKKIEDEVLTLTEDEINANGYKALNVFIGNKRQCTTGRKVENTYHHCEEPNSPRCRCVGCLTRYHLPRHPMYLRDEDDDFDSTYCTFYFHVPDAAKDMLALLAEPVQNTPAERWTAMLGSLRSNANSDDAKRALAVGEAIIPQIISAMQEPRDA